MEISRARFNLNKRIETTGALYFMSDISKGKQTSVPHFQSDKMPHNPRIYYQVASPLSKILSAHYLLSRLTVIIIRETLYYIRYDPAKMLLSSVCRSKPPYLAIQRWHLAPRVPTKKRCHLSNEIRGVYIYMYSSKVRYHSLCTK